MKTSVVPSYNISVDFAKIYLFFIDCENCGTALQETQYFKELLLFLSFYKITLKTVD